MTSTDVSQVDEPRLPAVGVARSTEFLLISLGAHVLALALPLALVQTYDRIIPNQSYGTITALGIGVLAAILLEAVLRFGRSVLFAHAGARLEAEVTVRLVDRMTKADVRGLEQKGSASLTDAIRSVWTLRDFWSGNAATALYEFPFVFVYIGLIAYIGGLLALIPLALTALAFVVALGMARGVRRASRAYNEEESEQRNFLWCAFDGLAEVKSLAAETMVGRHFAAIQARMMGIGRLSERRLAAIQEMGTFLGQLSTLLIVTFGAIMVIEGDLTTGGLAGCTLLAGRSIGPAMAAFAYLGRLGQFREAEFKVREVLALPLAPVHRHDHASAGGVEHGTVEIESAALGLSPAVKVEPGEMVVLSAPDPQISSRLLNAIAATTGDEQIRILVDGHAPSDHDGDDYRNQVALVSGRTPLVPGSILNNLTMYDPRLNVAARDLSERIGLSDFAQRLHNGLLTPVGPLATQQLDEGIVQRIGLVRALLREPKILLLDHAANAMDLDGVERFCGMLEELRGRTTVLMATRNANLAGVAQRTIRLGEDAP